MPRPTPRSFLPKASGGRPGQGLSLPVHGPGENKSPGLFRRTTIPCGIRDAAHRPARRGVPESSPRKNPLTIQPWDDDDREGHSSLHCGSAVSLVEVLTLAGESMEG